MDESPDQPWVRAYRNNKGAVLILCAEAVATSMDAIVRWLQQGEKSMHPYQIIFARMGGTFILSSLYMWLTMVPDFPLGQAKVRGLLVIRALFGFFGLFCLYCAMLSHAIVYQTANISVDSVHYLPLAEATVFRFLVPIVTAIACSIFLSQVLTRTDICAGIIALIGVVIIAHPSALFGKSSDTADGAVLHQASSKDVDDVSPSQRLFAIAVSLLGVVFASSAYTMIRVIGDRAHALISVNYFAVISTLGSAAILLLTPGIGFSMPANARDWVLLSILGVLGFVLQFLLTAGLQMDKSSKATSMMYSQIVFALLFDWGIWGTVPSTYGMIGGCLVMVSTLWAALHKPQQSGKGKAPKDVVEDEERPLLSDRDSN